MPAGQPGDSEGDEVEPFVLALPDPAATARFGVALAAHLRAPDVVALEGQLGAGKTTFARALIQRCAALDGAPIEDVPSPTFTLVQVYDFRRVSLFHFDLYRIEVPDEAWELGIEDAFEAGISLIEWPERIANLLPPDRLVVRLEPTAGGAARRAVVQGLGRWSARLGGLWPRLTADVAAG